MFMANSAEILPIFNRKFSISGKCPTVSIIDRMIIEADFYIEINLRESFIFEASVKLKFQAWEYLRF